MARIAIQHTTSQVESLTREEILKRFLRETQLGRTGVATAGSTSSVEDTANFKSSQYNSREWDGGWLRISSDAGGAQAAPEDEIQPIAAYQPNIGRFEVQPYFTVAPAANDGFEVWKINPQPVLDALDEILKNKVFLPTWVPLSEAANYDAEYGNVGSDWGTSNASVSAVKTGGMKLNNRYMEVTASAANGYIHQTLVVEPSTTYHLSVLASRNTVFSTDAIQLIAWDSTNSVEIDSVSSSIVYPHRLWLDFTTGATQRLLNIRLQVNADTDVAYFDDVVIFHRGARDISLPWWAKSKDQILGIFELTPPPIDTDIYEAILSGERVYNLDIQDSGFGESQLKLVARHHTIQRPLFIFGVRNEQAFTDSTADSKRVPSDLVNALLQYQVFDMLSQQPASAVIDRAWIQERRTHWAREQEKELYRYNERIEQVMQSATPDGLFLDSRFVYHP